MDSYNFLESEIDLHVDMDEDGNFIARVLHIPTATVKISDYHMLRDDAVKQVMEELEELIKEKRNGLVK